MDLDPPLWSTKNSLSQHQPCVKKIYIFCFLISRKFFVFLELLSLWK
jgi:hypothetical protein